MPADTGFLILSIAILKVSRCIFLRLESRGQSTAGKSETGWYLSDRGAQNNFVMEKRSGRFWTSAGSRIPSTAYRQIFLRFPRKGRHSLEWERLTCAGPTVHSLFI